MYVHFFSKNDMLDLNGALFLKVRFIFLFLASLSASIVILPFTTICAPL